MATQIKIEAWKSGDNYIWAVIMGSDLALIDPKEASVVQEYIEKKDLNLVEIFLTHGHEDHIGGVDELKNQFPDVNVIGHASIEVVTDPIEGNKEYSILEALPIMPAFTPGHSFDHFVYYIPDIKVLFAGDLIFPCGCGRIFTEDYVSSLESLLRVKDLPHDTKIYAAHEYSLKNAIFAASIEPNNERIYQRIRNFHSLYKQGKKTLPVLLRDEIETNPFLRLHIPEIKFKLGASIQNRPVEMFRRLRKLKDQFKFDESIFDHPDFDSFIKYRSRMKVSMYGNYEIIRNDN